MAAPREREQPWTISEKNYMLAEIIKSSYPSPSVLLEVINQLRLHQPNWNEIALPPGRALNACRFEFEEICRTQGAPMIHGMYRPQTPSPLSAHVPANLKRPFPYDNSFPTGREIRPKPSTSGSTYGLVSTMEHPQKKKRGRPRKTEPQAKGEAQMTASASTPRFDTMNPPATRPADPQNVEVETPISQYAFEPPRPVVPPARRFEIASILTPTGPPSDNLSSSFSGKRRRVRTRSEPEPFSVADAAGPRQMEAYESPHTAAGMPSQEASINAAVLRHEGDSESSFQQHTLHDTGAQPPTVSRSESDSK